jgi:hypothetical protein
VNVQVEVFGGVAESVTEQVTVVTPFANAVPVAGTQVTEPSPEQLSVAVASG